MTRTQADDWSIARSLAFLAATFAIVFGTLLPFAAMAASTPGHPVVICSAEGPQTIQVGADVDGPAGKSHPAKCAACLLAFAATLPAPCAPQPTAGPALAEASVASPAPVCPAPPARAPPRPPSTAPPVA